MDAEDAARAWIDAWERGWKAHDAEPIVARYAHEAAFRSHPFRAPEDPRAYVERAFADEEAEPELWFGKPIVAGRRAAVEYHAVLRYDGKDHTLAGVTVLDFDDAGLVARHRDYWALEEGRHPHREGTDA